MIAHLTVGFVIIMTIRLLSIYTWYKYNI